FASAPPLQPRNVSILTSICCAGKIGPSHVLGVRATTSVRGAPPLPARTATLPLSRARLQAPLQSPHRNPLGWQQALCHASDSCDVSLVPVVFLSPHGPRIGGAYADGLTLVLVAAQCRPVLQDGAAVRGRRGSG